MYKKNAFTLIHLMILVFIILIAALMLSKEMGYKGTITTQFPPLPKGEMSSNIPEKMKVGMKERIKVNIAEKIVDNLRKEKLIDYEKDKIKEIRIGTIMEVHLKGNAFKIENLNNSTQLILKEEETQWNWDVIPLKSGSQILSLIISIERVLPNDIKGKKDDYLFDNLVRVQPNLIYSARTFIDSYWQYFVAILIGFFVNGLLRKIKR